MSRPLEEFDKEVAEMVTDWAPRLFAVVQEYDTRMDARIAAWGLAHEHGVDVIGVGSAVRISVSRPEDTLRYYNRRDRITARIVWVPWGANRDAERPKTRPHDGN